MKTAFSSLLTVASLQRAWRRQAGASTPLEARSADAGTGAGTQVTLKGTDGSVAEVYPFGGVVTSWVKNGRDVLYVRPDAKFDKSKPISGGIPHCWPQFGPGECLPSLKKSWLRAKGRRGAGSPRVVEGLKSASAKWSMGWRRAGEMQVHGFARNVDWTVTKTGEGDAPMVSLEQRRERERSLTSGHGRKSRRWYYSITVL
jgi:hypothetical protein